MKKTFTIIATILMFVSTYAQVPESFKYQAVARNSSGELIINSQITMEIAIIQGSINGNMVFKETFSPTTNEYGIINLEIGTGAVLSGDFSTIDWGSESHFIKVWLNGDEMGMSQLLSVPYALHAKTADSVTEPDSIAIYTSAQIDDLNPKEGDAIFNITEGLYQIFIIDSWLSIPTSCWPEPTIAEAGSDQLFGDGTVSTTLKANWPDPGHGIGIWTILGGQGGIFNDATLANATFTGSLFESYQLQWTISTKCGLSSDILIVDFYKDGCSFNIDEFEGDYYYETLIDHDPNPGATVSNDGVKQIIINTSWDEMGPVILTLDVINDSTELSLDMYELGSGDQMNVWSGDLTSWGLSVDCDFNFEDFKDASGNACSGEFTFTCMPSLDDNIKGASYWWGGEYIFEFHKGASGLKTSYSASPVGDFTPKLQRR